MNRLTLMSVLFLTACGQANVIPEELTRPVTAECPPGYTSDVLGQCLLNYVAALAIANNKLEKIREISDASRR